MRSLISATLVMAGVVAAVAGASAQPAAPARPALQKPEETANTMGQAERLALQSDLAWVGLYNGAITGDASARMVAAIKEFQKGRGAKPTGVLNPQERGVLADTAKRKQESVGWKIVTDSGSGARLGIPTKLAPQQTSDAKGARWTSATGTVQIVLERRKESNATTAGIAEREKKEAGRRIDYTVVKPDFFVLSGLQGLKKFYLRGALRGDEVRILTILYDPAVETAVGRVVIAMSSAFNPFAAAVQTAGPPPRKAVEYGTGIVVSDDGAIIADRQITDGCLAVAIAGFGNADRVAEDKAHELALLRIYGARGLKALNLATNAAKTALDLTGIADPLSQGGGAAVSSVKASVAQFDGGKDVALSPAPTPGFSGSAALDGDGKFAGVALLKPAQMAGPANTGSATQAVLVTADTVRNFLKAHDVKTSGASTDARASVVRVICVRK